MHKIEVRLTQVYRINGRLVVANSIEGAINTWREWGNRETREIRSIERIANDSYQVPTGDDALVCAEGLCGDITQQFIDDISQLRQENEALKYDLEKSHAFINGLRPADDVQQWLPTIEQIKSVYASAGVMKQMNEHTDAQNLMDLWEGLKTYLENYNETHGIGAGK